MEQRVQDNTEQKKLAELEAILFAAGESVELAKLARGIDCDEMTTRSLLMTLKEQYQKADRGIRLVELEDAFQLGTKPEHYEALIRVAKQPRKPVLTDVVLETLSIIAYKQPVTKLEIEKIRGVKSDFAVNKLVEYGLVREAGRLEAPGRPILFATTEEFLRFFGISSVQDLPEPNPLLLEDFRAEAEEEVENKLKI